LATNDFLVSVSSTIAYTYRVFSPLSQTPPIYGLGLGLLTNNTKLANPFPIDGANWLIHFRLMGQMLVW